LKPKLKVLTLGWEFPPLLTGGLGIACYGLAKSLSKLVDLTVIVPQSNPELPTENFQLIGLNHIPFTKTEGIQEKSLEQFQYNYEDFAVVKKIGIELNPYPVYQTQFLREISISKNQTLVQEPLVELRASEAYDLFQDKDIYGPNIMRKVAAYTEVVCRLADSIPFDIIHCHDWITFAAGIKIKEKTGKPLVVHIHSLETDRVHPDARNDVYYLEQSGMQMADRVLPVSDFTAGNIVQFYGIPRNKITTVHNGIEPVHKFKNKKDNPEEKWVVFLGRVTRQKGPYMILETALKLIKRMPHVKFFVAGLGDQLGHLKYLVDQTGMHNSFVFTGFISKKEVGELLSRADVYFMPSISEPFGLSALEAAQFDVPCVISKQSGVSELMPNALKADFWDTNKFSDLLYALLNFEGISETLVNLTEKDLEKITWDRAANTVFKKVYSEFY
jgi:glycosyltransferase involved in cell wall biosynthesis